MTLPADRYSPTSIGIRLANARAAAGLSVIDAARAVLMDKKILGAYERGTRGDVPDSILVPLAGVYGVHPALLRYGGSEEHTTATMLSFISRDRADAS